MSLITNAKISTKLAISSGLAILLILGMIVNQQVNSNTITIANQAVEREQTILSGIQTAEFSLEQMRFAARDIDLAKSVDESAAALGKIKSASQKAWDDLERPINIALKPDVLKDIRNSLREYEGLIAKRASALSAAMKNSPGKELSRVDVDAALGTVSQSDIQQVIDRAATATDGSIKNAWHFTEEAKGALTAAVSRANSVSLAIGSAIVLVLIVAAFVLISSIGRPIRMMTQAMGRLAEGDTSVVLGHTDRTDEIGEMAAAVETFRQAAIENKRLEADAKENRLRSEQDRIAAEQQAEAEAAERLRVATSGLAAGLKRLAAGDLAFQLDEAFASDFEALRRDFNTSIQQLNGALLAISGVALTIDSGTREISQGATDLSKRTEQQAAALEETAAALDQITTNVSNSSKRADEARRAANEANTSATKSAEVVSLAVRAMSRIEQSSNQISNIIGVIDEIAFQTNLLALNAGVEAARAGEAGKGFAVVAQEVRELAQRSAQAAKEIKGLIQSSSVEVGNGVKLVSETGEVLKTIGAHVVTINHHIEEIATSAREQSVGLSEVNIAVNQMDQVTQQNAAMVEETTAASTSLASEATRLRELISGFDLGGNGNTSSSAIALRQAASMMRAPLAGHRDQNPASSPARGIAADKSVRYASAAKGSWNEF
ncbi:methyl-accepting chemotaxis protein [Rhizobium leguminosarum]|uniref:Methyl-accepting chemotaxis protein n=1 Tax=Rhizobium leguminosarum TaxID=384 RepID=A0ACD5FEM6_RHILE|nr:methyl-accepting chemotaxis protein [Rhizobium leguminosarum]